MSGVASGRNNHGPDPFRPDTETTYVVRFLNPTSNKPLHLGHFRNATLGNAISASLKYIGNCTFSHCFIEDAGPHMAQAIDGFLRRSSFDFESPKSDRIVGNFYRTHSKVVKAKGEQKGVHGRCKWALDSPEKTRAWNLLKEMALSGQNHTLVRAGIAFNCIDYESAEDHYLAAFASLGLQRNVFTQRNDGSLVYAHGDRDLVLIDGYGECQENIRLLSFLYRIYDEWPERWVNVIVAGEEWKRSMDQFPEILSRLGVHRSYDIYQPTYTGMVNINRKKMASSVGNGILIDTLMDRLIQAIPLLRIVLRSEGLISPDQVASLVLRSFFLSVPRAQVVEFGAEDVLNEEANPGWRIAEMQADLVRQKRIATGGDLWAKSLIENALTSLSFERPMRELESLSSSYRGKDWDEQSALSANALLDGMGLTPSSSRVSFPSQSLSELIANYGTGVGR